MQILFNDGFVKVTEENGIITITNVTGPTTTDQRIASVVIHPHYKTLKIYLDSNRFELFSNGLKFPYIKINP